MPSTNPYGEAYRNAKTPQERSAALRQIVGYDVASAQDPANQALQAQQQQLAANQQTSGTNLTNPDPYASPSPRSLTELSGIPVNQTTGTLGSPRGFQEYLNQSGIDLSNTWNQNMYQRGIQQALQSQQNQLLSDQISGRYAQQALSRQNANQMSDLTGARDKAIAQIQESYDPNLATLKQFLSDRGILSSGVGSEKLARLLKDTQQAVIDQQQSFATQMRDISENYRNATQENADKARAAALQLQDATNQRLLNLENNYRVGEENKQQMRYSIYQDYQSNLAKLRDDYQAQERALAQAKQDEFDREIKIAALTGVFQGQQTLAGQDNALAREKFLYEQQQDALKAKKGSGGGPGAGLPPGMTVQDYAKIIKQQIANSGELVNPLTTIDKSRYGLPTKLQDELQNILWSQPITGENDLQPGQEGPVMKPKYLSDYMTTYAKASKSGGTPVYIAPDS